MKKIKQAIFLFLIAFILHFAWESAQASLFTSYSSFSQHLPICFIGTVGDVVFTILVYLGIGLLKDNFNWIAGFNKKDGIVLAIIGFFFAIGIEQRALLLARWGYADAMPIIPYLQVGLIPILQMTLLLPLSFYLTSKWSKL